MIKNIRIEEVGDIHSNYNYLEVFYKDILNPIMEVGISEERELSFKFYPSIVNVLMTVEEWEHIISIAKVFLPKALKNEDDFQKLYGES